MLPALARQCPVMSAKKMHPQKLSHLRETLDQTGNDDFGVIAPPVRSIFCQPLCLWRMTASNVFV